MICISLITSDVQCLFICLLIYIFLWKHHWSRVRFSISVAFCSSSKKKLPACCVSSQRESAQIGNLLRLHLKEVDYIAFKASWENLMKPPALGYPNYQFPFFPFCVRKGRECPWTTHPKTLGHHGPIGYYSQELHPETWEYPPCLRAIKTIAFLVNTTETIIVRSPLNIFVSHAVESLLNSHHTQHFSARHLTSCKVLFLSAPHITLTL